MKTLPFILTLIAVSLTPALHADKARVAAKAAVAKRSAAVDAKKGIQAYQSRLDRTKQMEVSKLINSIGAAKNDAEAVNRAKALLKTHPTIGQIVVELGRTRPGGFVAIGGGRGNAAEEPDECKGQTWPHLSDDCINAIVIAVCKAGGGGDTCGE
ncbi:MAG: hypothetical protein AAF585_24230 [Verrucomicrobiota bacterium]